MNFAQVINAVCGQLDAAGVRYALIGGFAMALRGVQRATMDLDFILMLETLNAHRVTGTTSTFSCKRRASRGAR